MIKNENKTILPSVTKCERWEEVKGQCYFLRLYAGLTKTESLGLHD